MIKKKNYFKNIVIISSIVFVVLVIFFNSLLDLYFKKNGILKKIGLWADYNFDGINDHHNQEKFLVNPLKVSERQIPSANLKDLLINKNAHILGQWSSPVDWNVTAIHSVLLPNETVMTFGSFGIENKDHSKDLKSNKDITLTDGKVLERDGGGHQWYGHEVNSGIDFDIWDPTKGFEDNSHYLFKTPIVMDAFCSVVRVIDQNRVLILGGNKNKYSDFPDSQNATMIYNINEKKFELSQTLNYKRWYASTVLTGDQKLIMLGGSDHIKDTYSTIPEILDLNNIQEGWKILDQAKSSDLFGVSDSDEWNYPRSFLASDGNIVGISYNKLWVMDGSNNYRIIKTGEIPLATGGISKILKHTNPNSKDHESHLNLLTIGSAVGSTNSVIMIDKDQVIVFGGKQNGNEYSPSNKVFLIDFSNSFKPQVKELKSMNNARSNGNATIMPDGKIFLNGGHSFNDLEFSVFTPEIYDPNNQISYEMDDAYFRRNYHSTSLLLPNGTIFTAGGDVWNAEIFYPPYLFTKDVNNKSILAPRPKIKEIEKNIKRNLTYNVQIEGDIKRVTLISTGSTTHAQASESKFRELNFIKISDNEIQISLDVNPNNIQNGTYLLFVLDSKGVPSEGKIVYVN